MTRRTLLVPAFLSLAVLACGANGSSSDSEPETGGIGAASGTGGSGGTGGAGGNVGGAGTGGASVTGGTGGTAGAGGTAGSGGTGGTGGTGGSGGTAGASGTAGDGGTGGGDGGTAPTGGGGAGGGATGGGAGASGATACTDPVFVTSDPNGGWSVDGYYVHNNMWNSAYDLGPETLYACSYDNWYVVSNQTNEAGAVKTYPNVHVDYNDVRIDSYSTIVSTFAATSPHVGIYNVAYDIWINGVATPGCTEIMIWTENFNQVPAGDHVATVDLDGRTYDVWKTSNNGYIAFVPTEVFTSGTIDLLEIMTWTMAQGWMPDDSTLGQICFGVEIVSTDGADATFEFTDFSITTT